HSRDELLAILKDVERAEKTARRAEGDRDLFWVCRWLERRRAANDVFEAVVTRSPDSGRGPVLGRAPAVGFPLAAPGHGEPIAPEGAVVQVCVKRANPRKRSASFEIARGPG